MPRHLFVGARSERIDGRALNGELDSQGRSRVFSLELVELPLTRQHPQGIGKRRLQSDFVLLAVAWLISRTRLGLFVRGVTQNRPIAACMGVNTARVDTYAFALGSGIAGLAGCALSQVGNVGPDLGQSYIVDAFMVVVLGGVGQLAGTVYAAMGLGILNKFLEGWTGAVLAKIAVLVFIIVFIQKRPQGIFAMQGRET